MHSQRHLSWAPTSWLCWKSGFLLLAERAGRYVSMVLKRMKTSLICKATNLDFHSARQTEQQNESLVLYPSCHIRQRDKACISLHHSSKQLCTMVFRLEAGKALCTLLHLLSVINWQHDAPFVLFAGVAGS